MGKFGDLFKARRIASGMTLRQFCLQHKLDPGNISKLERGLFSPPQQEKLKEYAKLLGIKEATDDWYQFFDLAAAESGKIPDDILSDEEIVKKLPILFRSLRGKKVSDVQLNELVRKIKGLTD
jgi:transcriptional regulator with XRE-family HTH domain